MLIDTLELKKKWHKVAIWAFTIVSTGLVAISRIVVGAHFFSDVLMGGTIAFLAMIMAREIFISKGAHVKAMFASNKNTEVVGGEEADQKDEMIEVCTCGEEGCECPFDCKADSAETTAVDDEITAEETLVEQPEA